jgi:hypothetical protein
MVKDHWPALGYRPQMSPRCTANRPRGRRFVPVPVGEAPRSRDLLAFAFARIGGAPGLAFERRSPDFGLPPALLVARTRLVARTHRSERVRRAAKATGQVRWLDWPERFSLARRAFGGSAGVCHAGNLPHRRCFVAEAQAWFDADSTAQPLFLLAATAPSGPPMALRCLGLRACGGRGRAGGGRGWSVCDAGL